MAALTMTKLSFCPYFYNGGFRRLIFDGRGFLRKLTPRRDTVSARLSVLLFVMFSVICEFLRQNIYVKIVKLFIKLRAEIFGTSTPAQASKVFPEPPGGVETYVRNVSSSWVVPETRTKDHWLGLSNLDRVVNPTFSSLILVYDKLASTATSSCSSYDNVRDVLKQSLAKVLVDFYPLAGRLAIHKNGLADLRCNDFGALFLEAAVDADLSLFGESKPMPELSGLDATTQKLAGMVRPAFTSDLPHKIVPLPVLIVQVTRFKCSSIAIAVNWHHTVADGFSGCHFVKSWAEVAAGKGVSLKPVHDRSLLKPRSPLDPSYVSRLKLYRAEREVEAHIPISTPATVTGQTTKLEGFHLDKSAVRNLRLRMHFNNGPRYENDDHGRIPFSSVETISAHMWKSMTRARYEKATVPKDSVTRFFSFVDGRKRLQLPDGYFGNVVCTVGATSTERDILNKPPAHIASLIHNSIMNTSEECFRSLIDWVELWGLDGLGKSEHRNAAGRDVAATFWTHFPIYDTDFGWGKPSFATRNSPPREHIDGLAVMPSCTGSGNMFAVVSLRADRMRRIQVNPDFQLLYTSNPMPGKCNIA